MRAQPKRWMKSVIETARKTEVTLPYARDARAPRAEDQRAQAAKTAKARSAA